MAVNVVDKRVCFQRNCVALSIIRWLLVMWITENKHIIPIKNDKKSKQILLTKDDKKRKQILLTKDDKKSKQILLTKGDKKK